MTEKGHLQYIIFTEKKGQMMTTRANASTPIKPEILDILRAGTIQGNAYTLPSQLERTMYVACNEALTRIGGMWNRKAKAHLFDEDPTPLLGLMFTTGEMPPKNPSCFYPTPPEIARGIVSLVPTDRRVLEPSAGMGNIAEVIVSYCQQHVIPITLDCCEILPKFRQVLELKGFRVVADDFLSYQPSEGYDVVFMNPPFTSEGDPLAYVTHVEHAYEMLNPGGVLRAIVPSGFQFRTDRRVRNLRDLVEEQGNWRELPKSAFLSSGTGVNTTLITLHALTVDE